MSTRAAHFAVALASVAILMPAAGCTASTDKAGGRTVSHPRVLHVFNTRSSAEVQPFVDKVVALSGGGLKLAVDDEWERGSTLSEVDAIRAVQAGRADLAVVPARAWHSVGVNDFDALIAPLEVDSMALQHKVLASGMP